MQQVYVFDWKTFFSVFVPLVVLIVSPFLSLYIARKQIIATILSSEKKEWINNLRLELSTFNSKLIKIITLDLITAQSEKEVYVLEVSKALEEVVLYSDKVKLMLDPKILSHKKLEEKINDVLEIFYNAKRNDDLSHYDGLDSKIEEIMPLGREVLNESYSYLKKLK